MIGLKPSVAGLQRESARKKAKRKWRKIETDIWHPIEWPVVTVLIIIQFKSIDKMTATTHQSENYKFTHCDFNSYAVGGHNKLKFDARMQRVQEQFD